MTKRIFHATALCGLAGVALLCGGCVSDEGYVAGGAVYSDVGYTHPYYADAGPYYGGYGPAYHDTVVIEEGSRRGYYSDGRPYRASSYYGRRNGNGGYERSRTGQYARNRQGVQFGRGNYARVGQGQSRAGQGQFRQGRQGAPAPAATVRSQRGSGSAVRAQIQQQEQAH